MSTPGRNTLATREVATREVKPADTTSQNQNAGASASQAIAPEDKATYHYLCKDRGKSYPVILQTTLDDGGNLKGGTITWRGTTYQNLKDPRSEGTETDCGGSSEFTATDANGITADLCTATQGAATLTIGKQDFDCQMPEKYRK